MPSALIELTLESISAREIYTSGRAKKPKLMESFCYATGDGRKVLFSLNPQNSDTRYFGAGTDIDLATPVVEAFLIKRRQGAGTPAALIVQ